jgi:hypothetical protein
MTCEPDGVGQVRAQPELLSDAAFVVGEGPLWIEELPDSCGSMTTARSVSTTRRAVGISPSWGRLERARQLSSGPTSPREHRLLQATAKARRDDERRPQAAAEGALGSEGACFIIEQRS